MIHGADTDHRGLFAGAPPSVALNIVCVIICGLVIDARFGWPGQIATIAWTLAVFAWLFRRSNGLERRVLILCTLISGIGEVFLSLVWGLYDYQFHNVPLFVPPGHALLMTLGLIAMRRVPEWGVWLVSACASAWALHVWNINTDRFGVVLFGLFLVCALLGRARILYATMFVLALVMELWGTAWGNWRWEGVAPWIGLTQANPPFSAGAFYCVLDLLVLAALGIWQGFSPAQFGKTQAPERVSKAFRPESRTSA